MTKKLTIILCSLVVLTLAGIWYLTLPAFNLRSVGFWCFVLLVLIVVAIISSLLLNNDVIDYEKSDKVEKAIVTTIIAFVVLFAIAGLISVRLFNAGKAQKVAEVTVADEDISESFPDITSEGNIDTLPLVDLDTAKVLGDKKIAQLEHAGWYDIRDDEEYSLIQYQGKFYRLAMIDYGGFFKYCRAHKTGAPGYVLVDVTAKNGAATQEATLIKVDGGAFYTPGAFLQKDLRRHLRFQYLTYIFDDESYLEIDEQGVPYWVTGVLRPTAGVFGLKTIKSFVVTNAQTGESAEYVVDDLPYWIDNAYPIGYLMDTAYWHYAYADGFFNNYLSKTNVWRTSYHYRDVKQQSTTDSEAGEFANFFGYSSIVDQDGQVLYYTGLTAANNAESNLGWLTIDVSTGKMIQYAVVGAEESSAQAAVEQLVQAQRYEATFPLPINIKGHPSYIMVLKGKAGLPQGYAICNIENYSIAVQASTLDEAIALYLDKLGVENIEPQEETEDTATETTIIGKISAVYTAEIGGTSYFYYVIDGELYRASITINQRQVLLKAGDSVTISYHDDGDIFTISKIERVD